jgi:hypothetical protein
MKKVFRFVLLPLGILFLLLQLVPVKRTNPPVTAELHMPLPVKAIFQRSCYDCHSNETRWPWYSYVAPISWLVAYDVKEGRRELNFSEWGSYSLKRKKKKLKEIWEEVEKGKMPMGIYLLTHKEARLNTGIAMQIKAWTERETKALEAQKTVHEKGGRKGGK